MTAKIKILAIDDDEEMLKTLREFLGRHSYDIDTACDAREALIKLWTGTYDLAVTDIAMPTLSGLSLIGIVRAIPLPVEFIVVTGTDSRTNRSEAYRLGAKGYLVKPFDLNELLSLVESVTVATKKED